MDNIKKYVLGSLLIILVLFGYYKYQSNMDENKLTTKIDSPENLSDFKSVLNNLVKLLESEKKSKKIMSKQLKELATLNKIQTRHIKDITKKELFNKNIEKHRLFIDTHNINDTNLDRSNYIYHLNGSPETGAKNQTGGYDQFKNVIGFRLVKAIIPNTNHTVLNTRNTIIVQLDDAEEESNTVSIQGDRGGKIKITLQNGFFDTETIPQSFTNATYEAFSSMTTTDPTTLRNTYRITPEFLEESRTFRFNINNENVIKFKFIWSDVGNNSAQTFLGFNGDTEVFSNPIIADIPPDMSVNYIDLIIDEIPYIACKKNGKGNRLIDRIGITSGLGELFEYTQDWNFENENYFYPMKLDKLTIKLYETNHDHFFKSDRDHSLEFEITIIKNAKDFDFLIG
tara:strand:- start:439 stop:1632 length:1194 start_codon:yes stop_codon:yes gene_type:complete